MKAVNLRFCKLTAFDFQNKKWGLNDGKKYLVKTTKKAQQKWVHPANESKKRREI
jgi:hypothetical protein